MASPRDATAAIGRVAGALLPLLAVVTLRVSAPIELDGREMAAWIGTAAPAAVAVILALASISLLGAALLVAGASTAVAGMAVGSLSIGLTLMALAAGTSGEGQGLAVTSVAVGTLMVLRVLLPDHAAGRIRWRLGMLAASFLVFEAVLACALIFGDAVRDVAPWLLGAGAMAVVFARLVSLAVPGLERRHISGGLLLGPSLGALALARPGSVDTLVGLAGLLAVGLLAGRDGLALMIRARATEPEAAASLVPVSLIAAARSDDFDAERDRATEQAARLTRELRGTMEELLQARRTIELQRMEISRCVTVDALTGTGSRRAILERLAIEVAEARRYAHAVAVALLDIDDFRRLNEDHGLAVGDAVLREIGLRMRLRMRAADALGRVGSDSFVAILPHTDEHGAARFANAILERVAGRAVATEVGELHPAVSIGVALMRPGMDLSDEQLLTAAEEALASARAAGGNRIAFDRLHGLARLDDTRHA